MSKVDAAKYEKYREIPSLILMASNSSMSDDLTD